MDPHASSHRWLERPATLVAAIAPLVGLAGASCAPDDECESLRRRWCLDDQVVTCVREDAHVMRLGETRLVIEVQQDCVGTGRQCIEESEGPFCGFVDTVCGGAGPMCVEGWTAECSEGAVHPRALQKCENSKPYCVVGTAGEALCSELSEACDPSLKPRRCMDHVLYKCVDGVWAIEFSSEGPFPASC